MQFSLILKKKVWFSGHIPRHKLKAWYSKHVPRCKVAVLSETRSMTIGLLVHTQLTESTSNTDLHAWEHFQCWFAKTPWERFLTLEKLIGNFWQLHSPTLHFSCPTSKELAPALHKAAKQGFWLLVSHSAAVIRIFARFNLYKFLSQKCTVIGTTYYWHMVRNNGLRDSWLGLR